MIFQHKDGELRIVEHGKGGTTRYIEVLFSDASMSGPISRNQTEERLILDRGVIDSNAHYVEGGDASRLEPIALTFSCQAADTRHTQQLIDILSGATIITVGGATCQMNSRSGKGITVFGLPTQPPAFKDSTKTAYMIEVLYSGTSNWGFKWDEVYFPPAEQTVTESEDALTVSLNGQIYGGVTVITAFTTATNIAAN